MGHSNYKLTEEQKVKLNDIAEDIIEQLQIQTEEFAETTLTAWENYLNKISDAILANGKSHETQSNE